MEGADSDLSLFGLLEEVEDLELCLKARGVLKEFTKDIASSLKLLVFAHTSLHKSPVPYLSDRWILYLEDFLQYSPAQKDG